MFPEYLNNAAANDIVSLSQELKFQFDIESGGKLNTDVANRKQYWTSFAGSKINRTIMLMLVIFEEDFNQGKPDDGENKLDFSLNEATSTFSGTDLIKHMKSLTRNPMSKEKIFKWVTSSRDKTESNSTCGKYTRFIPTDLIATAFIADGIDIEAAMNFLEANRLFEVS